MHQRITRDQREDLGERFISYDLHRTGTHRFGGCAATGGEIGRMVGFSTTRQTTVERVVRIRSRICRADHGR